jgi:hypothetical protein
LRVAIPRAGQGRRSLVVDETGAAETAIAQA